MTMKPGVMLALGHGYSAEALSRRLVPAGWRVIGTTRSAEKAGALAAMGVEPVIWDSGDTDAAVPPLLAAAIGEATHLLASAAPVEAGDPAILALGDAIAARGSGITWAGYLSTVGVYGDRQGGWVDEESALRPATARGQARVDAERAWAALARRAGFALMIFRLAGIYGPGRGPFAKIRRGTARRIVKPGQVFSRIHVEDIATVLEASLARPRAGAVYNVCDNEPAPPEVVIEHAATLLGAEMPPRVDWDKAEMSPMALSFYSESKRCSNRLLSEELGVTLSYPTYREGLAGVLAAETA